eukprot:9704-Eustigmatos_ZCMA.PRE.1
MSQCDAYEKDRLCGHAGDRVDVLCNPYNRCRTELTSASRCTPKVEHNDSKVKDAGMVAAR